MSDFTCYIIGDDKNLLVDCGDYLLQKKQNITILGVCSKDSSVKLWCVRNNIKIITFNNFEQLLKEKPCDYLLSIANKKILSENILSLPKKGAINYHNAPLSYGGVYPTTLAILDSKDSKTTYSITWHLMEKEVDQGEILLQPEILIEKNDTAGSLNIKCYEAAKKSFEKLIEKLEKKEIIPLQTNIEKKYYSFSEVLSRIKSDAIIDWECGVNIEKTFRALNITISSSPNEIGILKIVINSLVVIPTTLRLCNEKNCEKPGVITKIDISKQEIFVTTKTSTLVLGGFKTIDGYSYKVENFINEKGVVPLGNGKYQLPFAPEELREKLEFFTIKHFKNEKWWVEYLCNTNPVCLPQLKFVNNTNVIKEKDSTKIFSLSYEVEENILLQISKTFNNCKTEQILFASVLAYLYRISGYDVFSINFSDQNVRKTVVGLEQFFSLYVPYNCNISELDKLDFLNFVKQINLTLKQLYKHASYKKDVFLRYPVLSPKISMQIGVFLHNQFESPEKFKGSIENVVTLYISSGKIIFAFDQNRLPNHDTSELQELSQDIFKCTQTLLCNALQYKNTPLVDLPILDEKSQNEMLHKLKGENLKTSPCLSPVKWFESNAEEIPENIAVVYKTRWITYFELNTKANLLANYLITKNIKAGDIVAVCFEPSAYYIVCLLAIMKIGATYFPIEPDPNLFSKEQMETLLKEVKPKFIITDDKLSVTSFNAYNSDYILQVNNIKEKEKINQQKKKKENLNEKYEPNGGAYIIGTSGSTGHPKWVPINNEQFRNSMRSRFQHYEKVLKKQGIDKVNLLLLMSTAFDTSIAVIFWALLQKGKLVLLPLLKNNRSPKKILNAIKKNKINIIICVPSLYRKILEYADVVTKKSNENPLSGVKLVIIGGDTYQQDLINLHGKMLSGIPIFVEYGLTETSVCNTSGEINQSLYSAGYLGRPLPGNSLVIVDKYNQILPYGIPGELCVGGNISPGYINNNELNKKRFKNFSFSKETMYKTGDFCTLTKQGDLFFIKRVDFSQIKIRGMRIELEPIEKIILEFTDVKECVVAPKKINEENQIVAYLVFSNNQEVEKKIVSLRIFLLKKFPDYMVPIYFVSLSQLPLTRNNKIDRNALPIPETKPRYSTQPFESPKTPIEKDLANIWANVLHVNNIGIGENGVGVNDNFFELGGTSLDIAKLMMLFKEFYGIEFPFSSFISFPTIKNLASIISNKSTLGNKQLLLEMEQDVSLSQNFQPLLITHKKIKNLNKIFLTGATGFLGSQLLFDLVKSEANNVYCLIRASNEQTAKLKLKKILEHYKIGLDIEFLLKERRIVLIPGDLDKSNFGLNDLEYNKLSEEIGLVIHCGAHVNHVFDYKTLRETNVNGTKRIISFSLSINPKRLCYISTLSAILDSEQDQIIEKQANFFSKKVPNGGYGQTKFISEILLNKAREEKQLNVTIIRICCWILGSSQFGVPPIGKNHLLNFISGCIEIKQAPNWNAHINILPVDIVSTNILKILQQPAEEIKPLYNVYNEHSIGWLDLIEWIKKKYDCTLSIIEQNKWYNALKDIDISNPIYPLLPYYYGNYALNPITQDLFKINISTQSCWKISYSNKKEKIFEGYFGCLFQEAAHSFFFFCKSKNTITEKSKKSWNFSSSIYKNSTLSCATNNINSDIKILLNI